MAKFAQFTNMSDDATIAVNAERVTHVYPLGDEGTRIYFGNDHSVAVTEAFDKVMTLFER